MPDRNERDLPELLAPAGSPQAFRAAIAAGADAVYLGGKRFGARNYAQNFDRSEIEQSVAYAHARGVHVYLTVNTLVHDRELADAGEYLVWLYSIGVDAILLQDTGLAELARTIVPELPLHASTQMTIQNADEVRWAADQGFARVVLARELSLEEIQDIARQTMNYDIGLEVFVHGALCYCYSGQCLLSSVIGRRSGNRGMCAQPCRKPYVLVTGDQDRFGRPLALHDAPLRHRYLLSPKDLCTVQHLDLLVQSPIVSLKIEGRMKSPEYVATVVSVYRNALNAIAAGTKPLQDTDMQDLALAFNRGFTSGYLFRQRHDALMGREQPDNRGLLIGEVSGFNVRSREVSVRPTAQIDLVPGDGLLFRHPDFSGEEAGFSLNTRPIRRNGMIRFAAPCQVRCGDLAYLTSSTALARKVNRIMAPPAPLVRHPIPIDLSVRISSNGVPRLEGAIEYNKGTTVTVKYTPDVRFFSARTRPLTAARIRAQLEKTGETPFAFRTMVIDYEGGMFAPIAGLNRMRREFLALARHELITSLRPSDTAVGDAKEQWQTFASRLHTHTGTSRTHPAEHPELAVYADAIDMVETAVAAGCDRVYFEPDFMADACPCRGSTNALSVGDQLRSVLAICRKAGILLVWKLPRIMREPEREIILPVLAELSREGLSACMVESSGAAIAVGNTAPGTAIYGAAGLNIFNHLAVRNLGVRFSLLTISPELSGDEIGTLIRLARAERCETRLELVVQGSAEAMVSEDCLLAPFLRCDEHDRKRRSARAFFGIRDSTGRIFPVRTDGSCRTHVFNAMETCLLDHIPSLLQAGIDSVAVDARGRSKDYAGQMVQIYREAISHAQRENAAGQKSLEPQKKRIKKIALGGITAGHFIRGLKDPRS
jgi:putative protease